MTIGDILQNAGIPRAEAELLVAHALQADRTWVLAHANAEMENTDHAQELIERRTKGEPVAYITGTKEFYRRPYTVTPDVLIPRPCTEYVIDETLEVLDGLAGKNVQEIDEGIVCVRDVWGDPRTVQTVIDVGTGSGCIAVTLACERPSVHLIATDTSAAALHVAQKNARAHGVSDRIKFIYGSLLENISCNEPFLVVSNPPYIPEAHTLTVDVRLFEPHSALFAGTTGRDVIDPLIASCRNNPYCIGYIIECRSEQQAL